MMFSNDDKIKLRESIEKKVKKVPNGKRLSIDKELLEYLLFDEYVIKVQGKDVICKLPIWSGDFLSKIDLSKVNFEDVIWNLTDFEQRYETIDRRHLAVEIFVNYSNTNAHIDFKKSYEAKRYGMPQLGHVNFSGVDLSNYDISMFSVIDYTDLSNTGIKVPDLTSLTDKKYCYSIFDNLDFRNQSLDALELISDINGHFLFSSFKNTGLNISLDKAKVQHDIDRDCDCGVFWDSVIKDGNLNGCYINGVLIQSQADRLRFSFYLSEYDMSVFLGPIDEQMKRLTKKD